MRILFILDEFLPENSGGAANVAFNLAKGLIESGNDLLVLTATNNLNNVGEIEIGGIKIRRIFANYFGRLRNYNNLKNRNILKKTESVLKEYKPDIVHIHTLHHRFSYGVIDLAERFSKAVFLTLHDAQTIYNGKLFPKIKNCGLDSMRNYKISWADRFQKDKLAYNPFQVFFIKRALRKADKIFSVSDALKSALEVNGISNIETIHNGIDIDEWTDGEATSNSILFAGRVDEAKGVSILVRVFDVINSQIPDAKLTIVGDGEFNAGGNKNIEILPWQSREEMKKIFLQARVVVVPSLYLDPFPTVNLEAMAASKPVIGTCFGGTSEIVLNNETGYVVNPYDEKKLAEKIINLLKNPKKAELFGKNGRRIVEEFFSLEEQIKKILNCYNGFI